MTSLFTEFEPAVEPPRPKPKPVAPKPVATEPLPPRKRLSPWSLPEIDATIADLRRDREEHWDCLIPQSVLNAAHLLPADELTALADYLLGRLEDLRHRVAEDCTRG
jgi:hypothetical protein